MTSKRGKNLEFELAKFTTKRDLYFSEMEDLYKLSQNIENPGGESAFSIRFIGFEEIRERFLKMVEVVNDLNFQLNPDYKPDYSLLASAERLRCSILRAASILKKDGDPLAKASTSIKLPHMTLPEFDGDVTHWPLFFEKFSSIVHNNPSLDNLAKLHYLLGALKGKALEVCVGFTPTAANYPVLLDALKARFGNQRILASHYWSQMLDLKPLPQESATGLSQVVVRFDMAFKSLLGLQLPDLLGYIMGSLLLSKVDPQTRRAFETSKHEKIPTYAEILEFVQSQIEALSQLPKPRVAPKITGHPNPPMSGWKTFLCQDVSSPNNNKKTQKVNSAGLKCPVCNNVHQAFRCEMFLKLRPADRMKLAQKGNWCLNCLSFSHGTSSCNSRLSCRICQQRHHTLLHPETAVGESHAGPKSSSGSEEPPLCGVLTNSRKRSSISHARVNITLLPTAVVLVETPYGDKEARFLVDSGSQRHFVTRACCRHLHLSYQQETLPVEGLGNAPLQALGTTKFTIKSRYNLQDKFQISALVTETITRRLPPSPVSIQKLQQVQDFPLADQDFFRPGQIDGILGSQLFGKIVTGAAILGPDPGIQAIPTKLGHLVVGEAQTSTPDGRPSFFPISSLCIFDNYALTHAVQKFWELEDIPKNPKLSKEEKRCEELFLASTTRVDGQRYCVALPFKEFPPLLGQSRPNAERRFYALERRFKRDPQFHLQYSAVLRDYLEQGHLSPVESPSPEESAHFIPHFAVIKESSSTPLRIVFDASARTSNGRSLNDVLFTGPKLQKDISTILIAFRTSAVALLADIRQMYRNIDVHENHRPFQQILWRDSPQQSLQSFQLNCVVFGVTSAPYLALRTVQQLADDEAHNFPVAASLAREYMYVDDLVVSLDSLPEALEAYQQLVSFFRAGGFKITKWASNAQEVLDNIPPEDRTTQSIDFFETSQLNDGIKVLGLTWNSSSDTFSFKTNHHSSVFSKRGILSTIARIWDPLGFLAPVILYAKLILKEVWCCHLEWDDALPPTLLSKWQRFLEELPQLHDITIPRHLGTTSGESVMLVGFADSSEKGYGAVVYLRSMTENPLVHLLCAKSRVAPKKTITLPKLELCAAVLLSELVQVCLDALATKFHTISKIALTDSTVTLSWIKIDTCKRETFVANRLSIIERTLSPDSWFHVRSADNMADGISRGLRPAQLASHTFWIQGPPWLRSKVDRWPIQAEVPSPAREDLQFEAPLREDPTVLLGIIPALQEDFEEFLHRFSSFKRLLRVTVCLLRFGGRLPNHPKIDPTALETAEHIVIRQVQRQHFPQEFARLNSNQQCSPAFRSLSPFIDGDVLRVGGRLSQSNLPYNAKHPLLLPKKSHLTTLIIRDCHHANLHTGPNLVFAILRQKFWIMSARSAIRKIINKCNLCFKRNPRPIYPPMADLPAARVQEAKPFLHTGVDYAGPFQITVSRRRGIKSQKAYLCLFICLATKAVHLELASSLSSDTFLACFKRFVSRRGPVQCLYSDRGTNFIGAKAELDEIHRFLQAAEFLDPLTNYLDDHRIRWKFNPPHAPHFGGIWEANIRSVKTHLVKVIGPQILSYEEFTTVLVQIEALLNSRPLCSFSPDPAEPGALTPAHFLTLSPLRSLPLSDRTPSLPLKVRKKLLDSIVRSFWDKWRLDYLTSLQHRRKWTSPSDPPQVGTVVVIKQDSTPPLRWPLAVVESVHPGPDGIVRVATVRSGSSTYERPVAKLCPLPSQ